MPEALVRAPEQTLERPRSVLPPVTPGDWAVAMKALREGDTDPMFNLMIRLELPADRNVTLFAAVFQAEAAMERLIAADGAAEHEKLSAELKQLLLLRPTTVDQAQKTAARISDVEKALPRLHHQAEAARDARERLDCLKRAFAELYGLERQDVLGCCPVEIINHMMAAGIRNGDWRSNPNPPAKPRQRRIIRPANMTPINPS